MFGIKSKLSVACATLATAVVSSLIAFGACSPSDSNDSGSGGGNDPCGGACPVGSSCLQQASGAYQCQCQPGLQACGNSCVDLQSDAANCGTCGNVCGGDTPYCSLGACSATCAGGTTACGFSCVDTASNPYHCGGCGVACDGGLACSAGTCGCAAGANCGGGGDGDGDGDGGGDGEYGGYITSGTWKGYAWTAVGGDATITPEEFGEVYDFPLCASGAVQPGYDNVAMVGWNINQPAEDDPVGSTVTPAMDGITVSITNNLTTQLRIQIQGPNGGTDENDRWCAEIGAGGADIFVPFSSFNTKCWPLGPTDTPGNPYAGEPLSAVLILVPGPDPTGTATEFNFCVDKIQETNEDGGGGGAGCDLSAGLPGSPLAGTMSLSNPFDRKPVNTGSKVYVVQNNAFSYNSGACSGCSAFGLSYGNSGDGLFRITEVNGSMPTDNAPFGYPSVFIGSNSGGDGFDTAGSNLPKRVGDLTSVQTGWAWTAPASGQYNAAYDVWFSTSAAGETGVANRTFLMVWFDRTGGINPEGSPDGTFSLNGVTFNVFSGTQFEGRPIINYVAPSRLTTWSFDLVDFINDAKTREPAAVSDDFYLTNIFAGFEIWSGSVGIKTDAFCASVN